jgi:hypothetical protein
MRSKLFVSPLASVAKWAGFCFGSDSFLFIYPLFIIGQLFFEHECHCVTTWYLGTIAR